MPTKKPHGRLIPDKAVSERYEVHISTLRNWDADEELNFPKPVYIRKRKFRDEGALDAWDQARAAARDPAA
jgi:hypothetical protein